MDSQEVTRRYLDRIGQLPLSLGGPDLAGGEESPPPTKADNEFLRHLVETQAKMNRRTLFFAFSLVLILFLVAVFTAVKANDSLAVVLSIGGVGTGFEAGLLAWLLRLWKEYNRFGLLLILCERLSPEDLMKTVGAITFEQSGAKATAVQAG